MSFCYKHTLNFTDWNKIRPLWFDKKFAEFEAGVAITTFDFRFRSAEIIACDMFFLVKTSQLFMKDS